MSEKFPTESFESSQEAHEGWLSLVYLTDKLSINRATILTAARNIIQESNGLLETDQDISEFVSKEDGRKKLHFSPRLVRLIEEDFIKEVPEGWKDRFSIAQKLNTDILIVENEAQKIIQESKGELKKEEEIGMFRIRKGGAKKIYFSPLLAKLVEDRILFRQAKKIIPAKTSRIKLAKPSEIKLKETHEEWIDVISLAQKLNTDILTIEYKAQKIIQESNGVLETHQDIDEFVSKEDGRKKIYLGGGRKKLHFSPQLVRLIEEDFIKEVPEGWITPDFLAKKYDYSVLSIKKISKEIALRIIKESNGELKEENEMGVFRSKDDRLASIYYSPKLIKLIESVFLKDFEEIFSSKDQYSRLSVLMEDIVKGETQESKKILKLIGLFGSSRIVDILYAQHPDFKGLPVEKVKKIISEYLGNFLLTRPPFNMEDLSSIKSGADSNYLENRNLKEGLLETMKEAALSYCLKEVKNKRTDPVQVFFKEFFDKIIEESKKIDSLELNEVIQLTIDYYESINSGFEKPDVLVDRIKVNRDFPDIYQSVNIKEISDKKRLLIADEMGVGKSGSAVLAKECLGAKLAVIVAPANVLSTWQKYLSDQVSEKGEQVGYFKEGRAPRVLVIENISDLDNFNKDNFDYVLISQERLNDNYTGKLQDIDYDMLIIDEVHKLKNLKEGVRSKNALILADKIKGENQYLAVLSGTPVPNKIEDVAMLLKLLYPEKYEKIENKKIVKNIINGDITELRSLLVSRMQMKSLAEHIEMPQLSESVLIPRLSGNESEIYEMLLDDDSISSTAKIKLLRSFLLNPEMLDITTSMEIKNTKLEAVVKKLTKDFEQKDKIVLFVNDYIEDVIRGDKSILNNLILPKDVTKLVIEGETPKEDRERIKNQFNRGNGKMLLIVSGQTAGVGVDFSSGQDVEEYNEPWTKDEMRQQVSRVYRPGVEAGVEGNINVSICVVPGTIEQGIHQLINMKDKAVQKLLKGIPINEIEREILIKTERGSEDLSVNPELAEYFISSFNRLLGIFRSVKSITEKEFEDFIAKYGDKYAQSYLDMGSRNYQANANRVSGAVIDILSQNLSDIPDILDLASGPEMLKRHGPKDISGSITSMDMNEYHFSNAGIESGDNVVGSFLKIPTPDSSFDFVNLSFSFHYTSEPIRGNNERLKTLAEINRVLRPDGFCVINMIHSLDFKDLEGFKKLVKEIGFRVVEEYTGDVSGGQNYQSKLITLQKEKDIDNGVEDMIFGKKDWDRNALRLIKNSVDLKDSRRVIGEFKINDTIHEINLNDDDRKVLEGEKEIISQGESLKKLYGGIDKIPREVLIEKSFSRILIESKYQLFKKLESERGYVVIK